MTKIKIINSSLCLACLHQLIISSYNPICYLLFEEKNSHHHVTSHF